MRGKIARVRSDGAALETIITPDTGAGEISIGSPDPLPDDRAVLATLVRRRGVEIAAFELPTGKRHVLDEGVLGKYLPTGQLLVVHADGKATVVDFDLRRLTTTGPAREVIPRVQFGMNAEVLLAVSADGTLLYAPPVEMDDGQLLAVARDGTSRVIDPAWRDRIQDVSLSHYGSRIAFTREAGQQQQVWIKELDAGPLSMLGVGGVSGARPQWSADGKRHLQRHHQQSLPAHHRSSDPAHCRKLTSRNDKDSTTRRTL
jgi:hypothetical protein